MSLRESLSFLFIYSIAQTHSLEAPLLNLLCLFILSLSLFFLSSFVRTCIVHAGFDSADLLLALHASTTSRSFLFLSFSARNFHRWARLRFLFFFLSCRRIFWFDFFSPFLFLNEKIKSVFVKEKKILKMYLEKSRRKVQFWRWTGTIRICKRTRGVHWNFTPWGGAEKYTEKIFWIGLYLHF